MMSEGAVPTKSLVTAQALWGLPPLGGAALTGAKTADARRKASINEAPGGDGIHANGDGPMGTGATLERPSFEPGPGTLSQRQGSTGVSTMARKVIRKLAVSQQTPHD